MFIPWSLSVFVSCSFRDRSVSLGDLMAVRAGVRSIEHGTYLSDEALGLMKQKGTFFVPQLR